MPTFERTAENTRSTGIGAARYASGIQPWKGKAGALTRNAAANRRKIHSWVPFPTVRCARSAKENEICPPSGVDSTPRATAPASIRSDPTSV